jgi:hypothetical protein
MARTTYTPGDFSSEVQAPWGYYQALEEGSLDLEGRHLVYTLGSACIEASCCGKGSWNYARVEGYLVQGDAAPGSAQAADEGRPPASAGGSSQGPGSGPVEVDTLDDPQERAAIAKLLVEKHPGVRVEFR